MVFHVFIRDIKTVSIHQEVMSSIVFQSFLISLNLPVATCARFTILS